MSDLIIKGAKGIQDGLYNIKDGKIFKYKAKGGTVRTYELDEIVSCKDCKHYESDGGAMMICNITDMVCGNDDYCSYGERREDGEA